MTLDQIIQELGVIRQVLEDAFFLLWQFFLQLTSGITQDHLEGALVMTVIFLGPSLVIGLLSGFWEGLRIEWQQFRERPRVIDGDTLEIRGERLRLFAVDTPEMGQPWWDEDGEHQDAGFLAKELLSKLVKGSRLSVRVLREDKYGRSLAIVKVNGRDVAKRLVSQGYAFASPGNNRYRRAHAAAKRGKKGFWRGDLQMPWDYRAAA